MATKKETTVIGDVEFYVLQWSATEAILNKIKFISMFGATIARLISLDSKVNVKDKKIEITNPEGLGEDISSAISILFKDNDPEEVLDFIKTTISGVGFKKEGMEPSKISKSNFDMVFDTDDILDVYKLFIFVLKVNYSSLMKGQKAQTLLAKAQAIV